MPYGAILNTVMKNIQRRKEILEDRADEAAKWEKTFNTETTVFLRQIKELDLSDSSQRSMFYKQLSDSEETFRELRNDDRINLVGDAELVIALDELLSSLSEMHHPRPWGTLGGSSLESERTQDSREDRRKVVDSIKRVHEKF